MEAQCWAMEEKAREDVSQTPHLHKKVQYRQLEWKEWSNGTVDGHHQAFSGTEALPTWPYHKIKIDKQASFCYVHPWNFQCIRSE